jgi:hypothetical protein
MLEYYGQRLLLVEIRSQIMDARTQSREAWDDLIPRD